MKTGIYLSYVGLGANLLHLSYCHQIAKKNGPVTIITLCKNLKEALADDPLIEDVYYLDKYYKKLLDIFNLSKILKQFHFQNLLIYYPSLRLYFAAKIAGIDNIWSYKSKNKKNLNLVKSAKELTENFLNIENCSTETNFFIDNDRIKKVKEELKLVAKSHFDNKLDYMVCGHYHLGEMFKINKGKLAVLGDWFHKPSYAIFDGEKFSLKSWIKDEKK